MQLICHTYNKTPNVNDLIKRALIKVYMDTEKTLVGNPVRKGEDPLSSENSANEPDKTVFPKWRTVAANTSKTCATWDNSSADFACPSGAHFQRDWLKVCATWKNRS